jgi:hypothetical protein
MRNNDDRKGGLLSGKPHSEGGIKGVIKDDQRPVELEGGEAIVNKTTMKSDETFEFEGDEKTPCEIISDLNQLNGKGVPISCDTVEPASRDAYKKGGSVGTETETYKKWRSLVNMTYSQIKSFYNSQEGKDAGLSAKEASEQGIDSGRESARWLLKMKQTKQSDWTPLMWKWAKKQISFISRMRGNRGGLYDDKGNKTRKHTSLLIWGHNPTLNGGNKLEHGGAVERLLAPNGKPSNLTLEQYKLVRTKAFKAWFGDWENDPANASKVVDENGEPLVVYHRSKKTFHLFDTEKQSNGWLGKGFYFSESENEFKEYGKKLFKVFLNLRKPFKVKGEAPSDFLYEIKKTINTDEYNTTQSLKDNFYDGVIYKHWDYEGKMYVAFNPEQIKLADGSNTTFDPTSPDIRFAEGGNISKTPAPKKEQIIGSKTNEVGSASDSNSAKNIDFSERTMQAIENKVAEHNKAHKDKKVTIGAAKAVVRRGMGAYSTSHRPTISGGQPNSRVAWGLARLNAFLYKIVNGKSESGKYTQDDDLIAELGYSVQKYKIGGIFQGTPHDFDKYSTEYIGTGEGLQAFGWGLYFTSIKDIAKTYAKNDLLIAKEIRSKSDKPYHLWMYLNIPYNVVDKLEYLKISLKELEKLKNDNKKHTWDGDIEAISSLIDIVQKYQGKIYSVTLFKGQNESDYDLIQWEKPLNTDNLIKIFEEAGKIGGIDFKDGWELDEKYGLTNRNGNKVTGEEMYRWLSKQLDGDKEASLFLLSAGIDGIRYKAGTLSGMGDKEGYNYVIFDAADVTIENKEKYVKGGSVLLAPNGQPSNLTLEQWHLVRTASFKQWFGDWQNSPETASKVVDENGEPLVVYHGSNKKFTVFNLNDNEGTWRKKMIFVNEDYEISEKFAKLHFKEISEKVEMYKLFVNCKNPYDFDTDRTVLKNNIIKIYPNILDNKENNFAFLETKNIYSLISKNGFDGMFVTEKMLLGKKVKALKNLGVFNATQVKLADGTNTTFNGSNPDIRYARGGAIKKITPSPKFYEKGGEITPQQAAEQLYALMSTEDKEKLKQAYIEARNAALLESQKRIEYLESSAVKLKERIGTSYVDEHTRSIRDVLQLALRHERNVELAYTNGGSIATLEDKIGNTYKSIPDFSNIDTTTITFDEETILEDPRPPYIPFIDEQLFARKGYIVDAIRVMPDLYVYAVNGFKSNAVGLLKLANSPVAFANLEDISGYILVTLDQLVLITDYYITIAKAKARLEAVAQTERNKKYYESQSEGYRERILNQRGFYRTLPLSIQKKVTQEDWEALDLQGKEAIYKPYKRQGAKRAVSNFQPNKMYESFHLMYEVFLNPEAKLRGRTGHPEVFAYWRTFAEMMSYKLIDISEARKFESESYQAGLETSFGDSNTDSELYNTYGILVKRQNGDNIAPFEIDQIKDAWIKLNSTFGKLTRQAKEFGLKISHAGLKHMYARKSIGVYWSRFKTIGVSNIYGAKPFTYIFAHEVGHWIDNLLGSQTGKRYLCDDYESEAGQIAVAFRKNMNKKSFSDYYNSTKECFARAMEQHFAMSTDGDNASMVTPIEDKVKEMLYVLNDNYVSADSYHNTIKPLILAFFVKYKDFFVYDTDIVEDMPAVIEPNAKIETTKEAVAEAKKEVSDLPKQQATRREGSGQVINSLFSEWNSIKNEKQQNLWEAKVKETKFGTYGTISIFDILENFPLTGVNEVTRLSFLSDLEGALQIPFYERKYNTKVDIDLGQLQRQHELALAMEVELALIEIELELE